VIKCVIWDLDNTLLDGIYLESPDDPPPAVPAMAAIVTELAGRGILQAIASRNPPEAASYAERAVRHSFAAARYDWGPKSAAVTAIMSELGIAADAVAFVDDDSLERAEVAFTHPDVLVLAPQDMPQAMTWPDFSPAVVTDEARRRGELYRQRRIRQEEARAFGGSREAFLRYCQTRVTIGPAGPDDLPRLHELSVRTHQFNSAGSELSEAELARLLGSDEHLLVTVKLSDRFGDDGLVGGCVLATGESSWRAPLLMMSCRAMGRGVIDALLAWTCRTARSAGAAQVAVPCLISPRNVPLRIALTGVGFRAGAEQAPVADAAPGQEPAGQLPEAASRRVAIYRRELTGELPIVPTWVTQAAP
jgi:methoxymalonate biosynthesis protein